MTERTEDDSRAPLLDPQALSHYLLRDRREIVPILKSLAEKRAVLTAYIEGQESFITSVLGLGGEDGSLILDVSPDEKVNARAAAASELIVAGQLERIRLQFSLSGLERFPYEGHPALRAALPESVLRLQRREFFRLATPVAAPPVCNIVTEGPTGERKTISVKVVDISSGGVAVIVPPAEMALTPGMDFDDCRLYLPEGEPIPVRIRVRNLFQVDRQNGVRVWRAGCEFFGLSNAMTARIQRYIFKVERDRKAREGGF